MIKLYTCSPNKLNAGDFYGDSVCRYKNGTLNLYRQRGQLTSYEEMIHEWILKNAKWNYGWICERIYGCDFDIQISVHNNFMGCGC